MLIVTGRLWLALAAVGLAPAGGRGGELPQGAVVHLARRQTDCGAGSIEVAEAELCSGEGLVRASSP